MKIEISGPKQSPAMESLLDQRHNAWQAYNHCRQCEPGSADGHRQRMDELDGRIKALERFEGRTDDATESFVVTAGEGF